MTEAEHLAQTKAKVAEEQDLFFAVCAELEFDHSGHKSEAEGIVWQYRNSRKKITRLWAEHLKLFPDSK